MIKKYLTFLISHHCRCFLKTGISHSELLETYMEIFRRWNGKKAEKLLQLLGSISAIAVEWTRIASG